MCSGLTMGQSERFQDGRVLRCDPPGRDASPHSTSGSWGHAGDGGQLQRPRWGRSHSHAHALLPAGRHHVLNPVPPHGEGSAGTARSWSPLPLAGVTPGGTGCPGRGIGLVTAPQLPGTALPANPSPLVPLRRPAHVPPAPRSGPDSHPASSLPSVAHSFCVEGRRRHGAKLAISEEIYRVLLSCPLRGLDCYGQSLRAAGGAKAW